MPEPRISSAIRVLELWHCAAEDLNQFASANGEEKMSIFRRWPFLFLLCAWLGSGSLSAFAHSEQAESVAVDIKPQDTFLEATIRGDREDIEDVVKVQPKERNGGEFAPAVLVRLQKYLDSHLELQQSGETLRGKIKAFESGESEFRLLLRYERPQRLSGGTFKITSRLFDNLPNASTFVSLGGTEKEAASGATVLFDSKTALLNPWSNARDFALMGMGAILTNFERIVLVVALLFTTTNFTAATLKPLIKVLVGFSVAYSVTLMLSAWGTVTPNTGLIGILLALSIICIGIDNLLQKGAIRFLFGMGVVSGLVFGFALSSALRDVGVPQQGRVWCLLSFNLGAVFAQIMVCGAAFFLFRYVKRKVDENERQGMTFNWMRATRLANGCVVAAGGFWLLERVFSG